MEGDINEVTEAADTETANNVDAMELEYDAQYFGFTAKSFSNGVYNAAYDYLHDYLKVVKAFMSKEFSNVMSEQQIDAATGKLLHMFTHTLDMAFDKLEIYLKTNIFHVPDTVLLPEDVVQRDRQYTLEEEEAVDQDIQRITDKIWAVKCANARMRQELEDVQKIQVVCDDLLNKLQGMEKTMVASGVTNLKDAFVYTTEKTKEILQVLRDISDVTL